MMSPLDLFLIVFTLETARNLLSNMDTQNPFVIENGESAIEAIGVPLLAISGIAVVAPLAAGLLGIGIAAGIGNGSCSRLGPVYCTARSGQCCLLVIRGGRLQCPARC